MKPQILERALWGGAVILCTAAVASWHAAPRAGDSTTAPSPGTASTTAAIDSLGLAHASRRVIERDPFRLDRRPADVRFDPNPAQPTPAPAPPPPRTAAPVLLGITGPPWQAILEGIPGRSGSVVARLGAELGPFTITRITRDTVVIHTPDTTFTLTVRRQWR